MVSIQLLYLCSEEKTETIEQKKIGSESGKHCIFVEVNHLSAFKCAPIEGKIAFMKI